MLAWVFIFLTLMGSNIQHVTGEFGAIKEGGRGGGAPFFLGLLWVWGEVVLLR